MAFAFRQIAVLLLENANAQQTVEGEGPFTSVLARTFRFGR